MHILGFRVANLKYLHFESTKSPPNPMRNLIWVWYLGNPQKRIQAGRIISFHFLVRYLKGCTQLKEKYRLSVIVLVHVGRALIRAQLEVDWCPLSLDKGIFERLLRVFQVTSCYQKQLSANLSLPLRSQNLGTYLRARHFFGGLCRFHLFQLSNLNQRNGKTVSYVQNDCDGSETSIADFVKP